MTDSIIKVVHISTSSEGGAGTAAYRIHQALLANGVNSNFIYIHPVDKNLESVARLQQQHNLSDKIICRLKKYLKVFPDKRKYFNNRLKRIRPMLTCEMASTPFSPYNILKDPSVQNADIIHLHWVAEMLDYPSFFQHNEKPVVWTLHDMNPFKGVFHYEEDEKKNNDTSKWLDDEILKIKQKLIQESTRNIKVVSPSQWLLKKAKESNVFENMEGHCIRYTLNTEIFLPNNCNNIRERLKIPEQHIIFLFVAQSIQIHRKGFDLLIEALKDLKTNAITLLVVGNAYNLELPNLDIRMLGNINEDTLLRDYYSVADAFVMPSREDNLPNVIVEAMACGTPVLSFNVGGMAEIIRDGFNGLKAYKTEPKALSNIMNKFIETKKEYSSRLIRNYALENFSNSIVAEKYKQVYQSALKK
jgi:glycosyltransferase involved in cell wall biosynthesis